MKLEHFDRLWNEAKKDVFRLGILNEYVIKEEHDEFLDYKNGVKHEPEGEFMATLEEIKKKTERGIRIQIIQVLDLPLTEYSKFEIECGFLPAQAHGAEYFILERKDVSNLLKKFKDFWIFDESVVLPLIYDEDGRFIREGEPITKPNEIKQYIELKNELFKKTIPMDDFLKQNKITF